jgi:hypothetical protein
MTSRGRLLLEFVCCEDDAASDARCLAFAAKDQCFSHNKLSKIKRPPLRRLISIFFTCSGVRSNCDRLEEGGGVVSLPLMAG